MTGNSQRRAAQERVATYHEAELAALVQRLAADIDRFRQGDVDAFGVDRVVFHYGRAAKELWKFCNSGDVELARTSSMTDLRSTGGSGAGRGVDDQPSCPP